MTEYRIPYKDGSSLAWQYEPPTLDQTIDIGVREVQNPKTPDDLAQNMRAMFYAVETLCSGFERSGEPVEWAQLEITEQWAVYNKVVPDLQKALAPKELADSDSPPTPPNRATRRRAAKQAKQSAE